MKDDTISRQAVLKLLSAMPPEEATTKAMLIQSVKQMDAQSERKRGKWIRQDNKGKPLYGWYHCSECGAVIGGKTDFCSECGADMREVNDERPD